MTDHGSIFVGTITIVAFRRNIIVINNYKINRINVYKKKNNKLQNERLWMKRKVISFLLRIWNITYNEELSIL